MTDRPHRFRLHGVSVYKLDQMPPSSAGVIRRWVSAWELWRYRYKDWSPKWYHYLIPYVKSTDELGRRTVVQHIPGYGFIVWAYRWCYCPECNGGRVWIQEILGEDED